MKDTTPYNVPKERGRWRALLLAALMHAALFLMLWVGVRWQSETPGTIEAEVWSLQPRAAAPAPEPRPVRDPAPEPPPPPVVKEQPQAEPPPPPKPEVKPEPKPAEPKPDIALEQEKKRKEEERLAQEKKKREEEEKRAQELKKRQEQERIAQEKKREEERVAREKKKRDEERRVALEKKRKEEALAREKAAAEEKARAEREAAELAATEKAREEQLNRINREVTGTGGAGSASRSQGGTADAGYAGKIRALIISNSVFNVPPTLTGNPAVEYAVELLPDGSLRNPPRKLKSSGIAGFDEAVLRAIEKSQPFPRDRHGTVPSSITISHRPKDQ